MPEFTYEAAGQVAHIVVSDELAPFYRADPKHTEVVPVEGVGYVPIDEADAAREAEAERIELEQRTAELKGAELDAAAKAAHVDHPSTLKAAEKRAAIVAANTPDAAAGDTPKEN